MAGFPRATANLFFDNRQTCKRDDKTLEVILCTEFCLLCDKQGMTGVLRQLRITFICIFRREQFEKL